MADGTITCLKCGADFAPDPRELAAALGRLSAGKPRNLSEAERERRRRSMAKARATRWKTEATE